MNIILDLMKLQGKLRISFIKLGVDEPMSAKLTAEALHIFITSDVAKEEYHQAYEQIEVSAE